jgi:hypothetical protein
MLMSQSACVRVPVSWLVVAQEVRSQRSVGPLFASCCSEAASVGVACLDVRRVKGVVVPRDEADEIKLFGGARCTGDGCGGGGWWAGDFGFSEM